MSQGACTSVSGPFLVFTIEPETKKRFRYESEGGSHGVLLGKDKVGKKKTFPTVKLENYWGPSKDIFIRVRLCTEKKTKHVWNFQKKKASGSQDYVDENLKDDYTAEFKTLTILSKKKEEVYQVLMDGRIRELGKKLSRNEREMYENQNMEAVKKEAKQISNSVILQFDAFERCRPDVQICCSLYSEPICNQKASDKGDLKIHRMSKVSGSWRGGEEIILLCDKIQKDNIKIVFYEKDVEDGWKDYAVFNPADVHYQVAIPFKTPSYKENVEREVAVALERQDELSEPRPFTFIPDDYPSKKRKMDFSEKLQSPMSISCPVSSSTVSDDSSQEFSTILLETLAQGSHFSSDNTINNNLPTVAEEVYNMVDLSLPEILERLPLDNIFSQEDTETPQEDLMNYFDGVQYPCLYPLDIHMDIGKVEGQKGPIVGEGPSVGEMAVDGVQNQCLDIYMDPLDIHMDIGKVEGQKEKLVGQMAAMEIKDSESVAIIRNTCDENQSRSVKSSENQKEKLKKYLPLISKKDSCGNTLLHLAVIHNKNISLLIQVNDATNSDILNVQNCDGQTALHIAVEKNHHVVRKLLLSGSNPNIKNADGNNCYHIACLNDFDKCMRDLLTYSKFPAGVNEFNYEGLTPLHIAIKTHSPLCFDILRSTREIDLGIKEKNCDKSLLHYAAEYKSSFIFPILNEAEIDVNIQDSEGNTPLHIACASGDYEIVKHLLLAKTNPLIRNFKQNYPDSEEESSNDETPGGQTPADLTNNPEILKLLKQSIENNISGRADSADNSGSEATLLEKLCNLLDSDGRWEDVATYVLDEAYINSLKFSSNPTRTLLDYMKKKSSGEEYIEEFKNVLNILDFRDAMQMITESLQPLIVL